MRTSFTKEQRESRNSRFLNETEKMGNVPRHGLFTQPVSLAIGDVAYVAPARKREGGKPIS